MNFATLLCIICLMLYVNIRCNSNGSQLTEELIEIFYKDGKQIVTIQEKVTEFAKPKQSTSINSMQEQPQTPMQGQQYNPMQGQRPVQRPMQGQRPIQNQNPIPPKGKNYNVFSNTKSSSSSRVNAINNNINTAQAKTDMTNVPNVNGMNIPQVSNTSLNEIAKKSNNFVVNNIKKNVQPKYKRN